MLPCHRTRLIHSPQFRQRREIISAVAAGLELREQVFHTLADSADTDAARTELMNLLDVTATGADVVETARSTLVIGAT